VLAAIEPVTDQQTDERGLDISVFPAMLSAYNNTKKALSREKQKSCQVDVYDYVVLEEISPFDFVRYDEIISIASDNADKFIRELENAL
jgi:predicted acylesterase/phospholipase RssA